jgi:hypothetical protein
MMTPSTTFAVVLGGFLFAGLTALGLIAANAARDVKAHERSVQVKGLAEREVAGDLPKPTTVAPRPATPQR